MSGKYKWIIAIVLVLGIVAIVQASVATDIYMPVIYVGPTITPIPTATPKPSDCLEEEFHGQKLKICFTKIDEKPTTGPQDEWVEIKNIGGGTVDMSGWRIASDSSSWKYDIPNGKTIKVGQTVRVYTKIGTDGASQWYMNRPPSFWVEPEFHGFWNNNGDCGYLKDENRTTINSFCYGTSGLSAAPVNN